VVAAAVGVLGLCARKLLPEGSFRARCGIGAIVALRAAVSAAYMGVSGFLPLLLTTVRHFGPAGAGVTLSITGVMWWVGSALQSRLSDQAGVLLRGGFAALTLGIALTTTLALFAVPVLVGLSGWAVAGLGIGMTTSTLSVLTMAVSDESNQGRNNSGAQMASGMASAVFFAAGGAVLALAGSARPLVFVIICGGGAVLALGALAGAGRVLCATETT
jgi:MFS family permease